MESTKDLIIDLYNKRKTRAELVRQIEREQLSPIRLPVNHDTFDPKQVDNVLIYKQTIERTKKKIIEVDNNIIGIENALHQYYRDADLMPEMKVQFDHDGDVYISRYTNDNKIVVEKIV